MAPAPQATGTTRVSAVQPGACKEEGGAPPSEGPCRPARCSTAAAAAANPPRPPISPCTQGPRVTRVGNAIAPVAKPAKPAKPEVVRNDSAQQQSAAAAAAAASQAAEGESRANVAGDEPAPDQPAAPEAPAEEEVAVGGAVGEPPVEGLAAALLGLGYDGVCCLLATNQGARTALLAALGGSWAPVGPCAPGPHERAAERLLAAALGPLQSGVDVDYLLYVARRVDRAAAPLFYWNWRRAATGDDGDDCDAPVSLQAGAGGVA